MINASTPRAHADDDILYPSAVPFVLVHLACFAAIWTGVSAFDLWLCLGLYALRMFAIGAGYHRYFSHRAFATGRVFQFVLAVLAQATAQKSVLWWAAKHRHHHLHSDTEQDVHSPRHTGFWYAHLGWIFVRQHDVADLSKIGDFTRYPELMWLHRHELVPPVALGFFTFVVGGWSGLVVGFFWSTVLLYHATFCINSLAHVVGTRRYVTGDDSRNNWLLAAFTFGEGWHNNHHAYQSSARQGFRAWQIDLTFYVLTALSWCRVVTDMKAPPAIVIRNEQRLGLKIVERTAADLTAAFSLDSLLASLRDVLDTEQKRHVFEQTILPAYRRGADLVAHLHLPHLPQLPTRDDLRQRAQTMFAKTASIETIVERAHAMICDAVDARLRVLPNPA